VLQHSCNVIAMMGKPWAAKPFMTHEAESSDSGFSHKRKNDSSNQKRTHVMKNNGTDPH